jgi:hypothetical protein|tara:strand:+ start:200 stop:676 length:477 start_codon:yes stop_codon:yes gene_type:complete
MTHKTIELFGNTLKVFEDGKVFVKKQRNPNKDEFYEKVCIKNKGYLLLQLNHKGKRKHYFIHRLVAFCFLNLDIENPKSQVDHKDINPLNNFVSNLRIVSNQQNQFNRNAKGYSWDKQANKWKAYIMLDGKHIHLGYYETEEEASKCYQDAKPIHHII